MTERAALHSVGSVAAVETVARRPQATEHELRPVRRATGYERYGKPMIDRVGAAVLLLLLAPVMLAAALAIRIVLGPGVLYRQQRVGRYGIPFTLLKFRTMEPDRRTTDRSFDGPDRRRRHKTNDDPRHTRLGRFLRATSIDELPQLLNVLRGEMSLVGPRPEVTRIVAQYEPWQHERHDVKPGLTGLWQVTERDDEGHMHLHVHTDLDYIRQLSLWTDAKLLTLTIPAVLVGAFRYREG